MEVISLCPLPVAGLLWSTEQRGWSLTIICKATFKLAPGELELERVQLGLNRTDRHHDDEAMCSVYAPADLAPFKPRIDVMVVGHAHAPTPTAQVVSARLEVGDDVSKVLRVYGARTRDADGRKGPTAQFTKIGVRYERAVGGPGTVNPVGIPKQGTPEVDGSFGLANIELPDGAEGFAGFGPVAASWPTRRKKLGRHADQFSIGTWWEEPFPADLDLSFFNAAPDDQQLDALKPGDSIRLHNVHAEYEVLEVLIPKLTPQALLQLADGEEEVLTLRCDTVWIDTDLELLTLTWRGHVRLEQPDVRARCLVAASHDGTALSHDDITPLVVAAGLAERLEEPAGPPSLGTAIGLGRDAGEAPRRGQLLDVTEIDVQPSAHFERSSSEPPSSEVPFSVIPSMLTTGEVVMISSDQLESIPPSDHDGEVHGPKIAKLVWVDRARVRAIRSGWRELLVHEPRPDEGEGRPRELRDVHRVLVSAYPASAIDIEGAVAEAVGREQEFESPLVLTSGELRLSFDELAVLRAMVTAATPFVAGQYELEQLLTVAKNLLGATWLRTADGVAAELTGRIRETFASASRNLPPGYLEAQTQRIVVSERCYQRRDLWGRSWLRASFTPVHSRVAFAAYLPEEVADYLPLFDQFFARIIVHVDVREDQFETHPLALKVCALARVVDAPLFFSG